MKTKRVFSLLLCMILVFTSYVGIFATGYSQTEANSIYSNADVKDLSAKGFSLLDFDSGTIVYDGNGDKEISCWKHDQVNDTLSCFRGN